MASEWQRHCSLHWLDYTIDRAPDQQTFRVWRGSRQISIAGDLDEAKSKAERDYKDRVEIGEVEKSA